MINFKIGQLWWCSRFPFTNKKYQGKPRPIIIVNEKSDSIDGIMVTSYTDLPWRIDISKDYYASDGDKITKFIIKGKKFETELWEDDIKLKITSNTGLDEPSAARMVTIANVKKNTLIEYLGEVESSDFDKIKDKLKYIESQYFKDPRYFVYWMNRNRIEYSGILSLNSPIKTFNELIESKIADSFDIAMTVRNICKNEQKDNTIGIVMWEVDHGFNTHVCCCYTIKGSLRGSIHCMYDGIASFIKYNGSFNRTLDLISREYCKQVGYGKRKIINKKLIENNELEWLDKNCHKMSKLDIFGKLMGPWAQSIILDQANLF